MTSLELYILPTTRYVLASASLVVAGLGLPAGSRYGGTRSPRIQSLNLSRVTP